MKTIVRVLPLASLLLFPLVANAQKAGLITCARTEAYAYLYSSVTTMEISTTLKCGQAVRILDRSDNFVHVRTENGDDGFVPLSSVTFVKNGAVLKAAPAPAQREITHYDKPAPPTPPVASRGELVLANQTAVHLKLGHALSSETAKVGEEVNFEVAEDVVVNGRTVIAKGAPAVGAVTEAAPKGRMGKGGKLSVSVTSVQLANSEKAPLRSFGIDTSGGQKSGMSLPLMHGKEITLAPGTEMTAYVDGDLHLKISGFAATPAPAATAQSGPSKP